MNEGLERVEEQQEVDQGGSMTSRPPRQLRSRNVARSVKEMKTVRFHDIVECVELDQHYCEDLRQQKGMDYLSPIKGSGDY